jgi:hypothetical protein
MECQEPHVTLYCFRTVFKFGLTRSIRKTSKLIGLNHVWWYGARGTSWQKNLQIQACVRKRIWLALGIYMCFERDTCIEARICAWTGLPANVYFKQGQAASNVFGVCEYCSNRCCDGEAHIQNPKFTYPTFCMFLCACVFRMRCWAAHMQLPCTAPGWKQRRWGKVVQLDN